jgi:hypothetical protein
MAYADFASLRPRAGEHAFLLPCVGGRRRQPSTVTSAEGEPSGCDRSRKGIPGEQNTGRAATHYCLAPLDPRTGAAAKGAGSQTDRPQRCGPEESAITANARVQLRRTTSAAGRGPTSDYALRCDWFPNKIHPVWFRLVRVRQLPINSCAEWQELIRRSAFRRVIRG